MSSKNAENKVNMKIVILYALSTLFSQAQGLKLRAITWTGEFEFSQTQKGGQTYDNYWFGHGTKLEILGRAFFAKNALKRAEFAGSKALDLLKGRDSKPPLILIPYPVLTTTGTLFMPLF